MRFVEFTAFNGEKILLAAGLVAAVTPQSDKLKEKNFGNTLVWLSGSGDEFCVTESPAEVVAKLQGEPQQQEKLHFADSYLLGLVKRWQESSTISVREWNALNEETKRLLGEAIGVSAAPPAESEAVKLLERWAEWYAAPGLSTPLLQAAIDDTRALLAQLKGGKP
jgi:hypothetical protein